MLSIDINFSTRPFLIACDHRKRNAIEGGYENYGTVDIATLDRMVFHAMDLPHCHCLFDSLYS